MNSENFNQELILLAHEQLIQAFPDIGEDIIWEVLITYECSQRGIECALNKIMEISGTNVENYEEHFKSENNVEYLTSSNEQGSSSNQDSNNKKSNIEKFDEKNNFNPVKNNSISSVASNIWNNIVQRKNNNYNEVKDDDDKSYEMEQLFEERKKDK